MQLLQNNLYDMHMHCHFSGDSTAHPHDIAQKAFDIGLAGICFTDHLDLDYKETPGFFDLDIPAYQKEIQRLKNSFDSQLDIRWGIELGLQPYLSERNNQIITGYPFDFVIGSTHVIKQVDIYFPAYYEGREEDDCYREYFEETLKNAQSDVDFDVYGHLDYIVRYGPNKDARYSYEKYRDIFDSLLKTIIENGKGIEINTGGIKYGLKALHPTTAVLKRYRELGGEIITIGSDAHTPENLTHHFSRAESVLKECGFQYYTIFKERKPTFIRL